MFYHGKQMENMTPQQWIDQGLMYLTEDRKIEGLVLPMNIEANITLASLRRLFPKTYIKSKVEDGIAREMIDKLRNRMPRTQADREYAQRRKSAEGGAGQMAVGHAEIADPG